MHPNTQGHRLAAPHPTPEIIAAALQKARMERSKAFRALLKSLLGRGAKAISGHAAIARLPQGACASCP